MKKLLLSVFSALLLSSSAIAKDVTIYVANKTQLANALGDASGMAKGDSYTIVVSNKVSDDQKSETTVADGTLVISDISTNLPKAGCLTLRSNQTDIDNLPQLQVRLNGQAHEVGSDLKLVFENISLQYNGGASSTSGQIIYWQKIYMNQMDMKGIEFKNCDISNYPRALVRFAPVTATVSETITEDMAAAYNTPSHIDHITMDGCKVHYANITTGNAWHVLYLGIIPTDVTLKNNMFYDIPYCSNIVNFGYITPELNTTSHFYVYNNSFLCSGNISTEKAINMNIFNMGAWLNSGSEFYIYNNLFANPGVGKYAKPTDSYAPGEGTTTILRCTYDEENSDYPYIMIAENNYLTSAYNDIRRYKPQTDEEIAAGAEKSESGNEMVTDLEEGHTFDFTACFKPESSDYSVEKGGANSWFYTAGNDKIYNYNEGYEDQVVAEINSCIGAPMMYVDEFPQEAFINADIAGETYGTPTISILPAKESYKKGDVVTITVSDPANTALNEFDNFKGWSGDVTSTEKSFELELTEAKTYNITATFEKNTEVGNILAAWYSSTGKDMQDIAAQIGDGMLMGVGADTTGVHYEITGTDSKGNQIKTYDLQTAALPYVAKAFQTRTNKFGEDAADAQVCTYQLRTAACARDYNRDYAVMKLNTTGKVNVVASFYRGTDSNASKIQNTYWSTDSVNWTKIEDATIDLSDYSRDATFAAGEGKLFGWAKVTAALPAECNNKDTVYVKIQGEVKGGEETADDIVFNTPAGFADFDAAHASDVFEYISNIVVTAEDFNIAALDNAINLATDTLTTLKTDKAKEYIKAAIAVATAAKATVSSQAEIDAAVAALNLAVKEGVLIYNLTPLDVKESVVYYTTTENFTNIYQPAGWMSHTDAGIKDISKKYTIVPAVDGDQTVSATNIAGIDIKNDNRNSYMAVKGVKSVSAYFSYNSARIGALDIYGTDVTASYDTPASNTSGVATLDNLDANQTYYIRVHAVANNDMGWYAVKFIAGERGETPAVAGDENGDGVVNVLDINKAISEIINKETPKNSIDAILNVILGK